jgi:hypothetical protein
MPPRYAYWTILIDNRPTAFRARERDELLPTLRQLMRTNKDVVMKWFARGRLWESREAEQTARNGQKERRGPDWRPGGKHEDPRNRFQKHLKRGKRPGFDSNVKAHADVRSQKVDRPADRSRQRRPRGWPPDSQSSPDKKRRRSQAKPASEPTSKRQSTISDRDRE